ncbi:hypothetical protein Drorol1_Dr00021391 [Drosera rotundifolia]
MTELQSQEVGESSNSGDPFAMVMPKEHPRRVRLEGRGVTKTDQESKLSSSSNVSIDDVPVKVHMDLVKLISQQVEEQVTHKVVSMVLAKLQGVLPNFDKEAAARLISELQQPEDASSGQGIRNMNSSASIYSPTDEREDLVAELRRVGSCNAPKSDMPGK